MADIEELQRRITAAIERIGKGVEALEAAPVAGPDPAEVQELTDKLSAAEKALVEEQVVTQQLQERVKALNAKIENHDAHMRARLDAQTEATAQIDLELQRLRAANDQLRENNRALREANEAGLADPHLVNTSMIAEIEALNAARSADIAEVSAISSALDQLIGNHSATASSKEEA